MDWIDYLFKLVANPTIHFSKMKVLKWNKWLIVIMIMIIIIIVIIIIMFLKISQNSQGNTCAGASF